MDSKERLENLLDDILRKAKEKGIDVGKKNLSQLAITWIREWSIK